VFFAIFMAILAAALFGSASPLSKLILESLTPFQLAGLLYLGAALGVAPRLIAERALTPFGKISRRSRWLLLGAVCCGGILGPLALLFGLSSGPASSVSLWLNLELVFTALIGHWFFRDHLDRTGWLALAGIVAASTLLAGGGGRAAVLSALLVALACLFWGFDNHFTALIDGITLSESTFWKGLAAGSVNLGIGLVMSPFIASWRTAGAALIVGVFSYGISIVLYITSAQALGATRGQMFFSTAPYFGMGLSFLLLGERIGPAQVAASLLIAGSLVLLFAGRHSHRHVHRPTRHEHWHRHDDGHHTHVHPGSPPAGGHVHAHEHDGSAHSHPHLPDIHHRHGHRT
jgi:drug/metabolite transporter (DMT)-like permease